MKKYLSLLFILLLSSISLFAYNVGSKIDYGLYYHPAITLDNQEDLPIYSSISSTYDFEPFYFKIYKSEIGPYISFLHVSRSLVYNNIYLRELCGLGFGLDWGYIVNNNFKINAKVAMGIGDIGESLNKEMYLNMAIIPSYLLIDKEFLDVNFNFILNVIYRKYLLSPTIGVGISINFDWLSNYLNSINKKNPFKGGF